MTTTAEAQNPPLAPPAPRRVLLPALLFAALALAPVAARFGAEGFILSLLARAMIFGIAAFLCTFSALRAPSGSSSNTVLSKLNV